MPLATIACGVVGYVYGNGRLHRLGGPTVDDVVAGANPPYGGRQRHF